MDPIKEGKKAEDASNEGITVAAVKIISGKASAKGPSSIDDGEPVVIPVIVPAKTILAAGGISPPLRDHSTAPGEINLGTVSFSKSMGAPIIEGSKLKTDVANFKVKASAPEVPSVVIGKTLGELIEEGYQYHPTSSFIHAIHTMLTRSLPDVLNPIEYRIKSFSFAGPEGELSVRVGLTGAKVKALASVGSATVSIVDPTSTLQFNLTARLGAGKTLGVGGVEEGKADAKSMFSFGTGFWEFEVRRLRLKEIIFREPSLAAARPVTGKKSFSDLAERLGIAGVGMPSIGMTTAADRRAMDATELRRLRFSDATAEASGASYLRTSSTPTIAAVNARHAELMNRFTGWSSLDGLAERLDIAGAGTAGVGVRTTAASLSSAGLFNVASSRPAAALYALPSDADYVVSSILSVARPSIGGFSTSSARLFGVAGNRPTIASHALPPGADYIVSSILSAARSSREF